MQFTHIANHYKWTPQQGLDKLIQCLRDKAPKFFSVKAKTLQENYELLCKKMYERFSRKDLLNIIRKQLQDLLQEQKENVEEYAEHTQELAADGYPDAPKEVVEIVAKDGFLNGCIDKKAALTAMDMNSNTIDETMQFVKSAITNQRVILGPRKIDTKRVTFETEDL